MRYRHWPAGLSIIYLRIPPVKRLITHDRSTITWFGVHSLLRCTQPSRYGTMEEGVGENTSLEQSISHLSVLEDSGNSNSNSRGPRTPPPPPRCRESCVRPCYGHGWVITSILPWFLTPQSVTTTTRQTVTSVKTLLGYTISDSQKLTSISPTSTP